MNNKSKVTGWPLQTKMESGKHVQRWADAERERRRSANLTRKWKLTKTDEQLLSKACPKRYDRIESEVKDEQVRCESVCVFVIVWFSVLDESLSVFEAKVDRADVRRMQRQCEAVLSMRCEWEKDRQIIIDHEGLTRFWSEERKGVVELSRSCCWTWIRRHWSSMESEYALRWHGPKQNRCRQQDFDLSEQKGKANT